MSNNNPDLRFLFHYPFNKKESIQIFFSYYFWIVNILQILGNIFLVFMMAMGWTVTEDMRTIASINLLIGGGTILFRIIGAVTIMFIQDYKKEAGK